MMRIVVLLAVLLSGCAAVGPNFRKPAIHSPAQFRGAENSSQSSSLADLPWWEVFSDSTLKALIQKALTNNYDLRVAISRIEQSRELAVAAHAQFLPVIGYSGAVSGGRNEFAGSAVQNGGSVRGAFATVASASWEADIWGRVRRSNEAALATFLATEQARRGIQLSVASDTAQAYFELLGLDMELGIARRTTASFAATLNLFQRQLEGGVASRLDTSRAAAARSTASSQIPELERQIALKENQISVLIGENPGPVLNRSALLDHTVPPEIPIGIPSELLERRPDILGAALQVKAANAQIGIAEGAFFPKIGLTTFLGGLSSPLLDIASGKVPAYSFAANLSGPIYAGGALRAEKRRAIALWQQSRLEYEQAALNAFQDVSSTLISRQKFDRIRTEQIQAVNSYQESVDVALKRYTAGRASYFDVLDAQQQLFPAENALAYTEINRRVVMVQLYKVLGGGWNLSDSEWTNPK